MMSIQAGRYGVKTIIIDDNIHALIIQKQSDIRERYDINLTISYIVNSILKHYISKMEDILKKEIGRKTGQGISNNWANINTNNLEIKNTEDV